MNLIEILTYLAEDVNIDELNSKVKNDVPISVLDALASKMKKNKYDKIAVAIIKKIQEINTSKITYLKKSAPYIEYLEEHPATVYFSLKKAAKGNPKFDPNDFINFSLDTACENYSSPKKYWYSIYSSNIENREEEKFGLGNARIKDMGEEILYFPKTFKSLNDFGLSDDDLGKQWQDIRALSEQMAKRDKSGETKEEGEQTKKASDNHWCVASSNDSFYKDYKEFGGLFVIVVKKKPDGSPDFSRRYLFYVGNSGDEYASERYEFADKFDIHVNPDSHLSKKTADFLYRKLKPSSIKRKKQNDEVYDRVHKAFNAQRKSYKSGGDEWKAVKALTILINNKAKLDNDGNRAVNSDYVNRMFVPFNDNGYKGGDKYLRGNKKITTYYDKYRVPRLIVLPYDIRLSPSIAEERYAIKGKDKKFICYLDDPNMLKKVKEYLDSYVAEGPEKLNFFY